jgi:hypothetical protein
MLAADSALAQIAGLTEERDALRAERDQLHDVMVRVLEVAVNEPDAVAAATRCATLAEAALHRRNALSQDTERPEEPA